MQNEVRELIFFPSKAPEVLSMNAADRDHWLMQEMRRARARTLRHGLATMRNWAARRLGLTTVADRSNVVSVSKRVGGEGRRGRNRHVA